VIAQGEDAIKQFGSNAIDAFYKGFRPQDINYDAIVLNCQG